MPSRKALEDSTDASTFSLPYCRTQNYRVLLAAVVGGLRTGARVGVWTLAWVGLERAMGELRARYLDTSLKLSKAQGDLELPLGRWLDGGVAGLGIATGASILCEFGSPSSSLPRLRLTPCCNRSSPRPSVKEGAGACDSHWRISRRSSRLSAASRGQTRTMKQTIMHFLPDSFVLLQQSLSMHSIILT